MKPKYAAFAKAKEGVKTSTGLTAKPAEAPRSSKMPRMPERKPS